MDVCDFSRSFLTFVTHGRGNNARLQVESVCRLEDKQESEIQTYYFYASCKSEDTFAARNLFYEENYDFCGVFSDDDYVIYRTMATHTDRFREQGKWRDRFEDLNQHIVRVDGRVLDGKDEIVQASLSNVPLVGQVDFGSADGRFHAQLEFPVKTMNANDIETIYQVDTGPVAFPDFEANVENNYERLSPAYVAYNTREFADFVIQTDTPVGDGNVSVTHYSRLRSVEGVTRVLAV